tara:strand:- start:48 stop:371 length:324 start_codon:yes stop_codon:yes gene_type:complete
MEINILRAKAVCEEYCEFVKCDTVKCRIDLRVSETYFAELYTRMDNFDLKCNSIQKINEDTEIMATFILNRISHTELFDFFKNLDDEDFKDLELLDEDDESDWWKKS